MESLRELYRIGVGPSSSHTMGPAVAPASQSAALPTGAAYTTNSSLPSTFSSRSLFS